MLRVQSLSIKLLSGALLIACGSSSQKDDPGTTHGGSTASNGGSTASNGGSTESSGGSTASNGGNTASSGGSTASSGGAASYASRRTPTCLALQKAICDYSADKCAEGPRADCDEFYSYFFCSPDAMLMACLGALPTADCATFPDVCDSVFDVAVARAFCQDELIALCRADQACSGTSPEICFSNSVNEFCEPVIGVGASGDACLNDLRTWDCHGDPPANCTGILLAQSEGGAGN